jgi:hypothetical protein
MFLIFLLDNTSKNILLGIMIPILFIIIISCVVSIIRSNKKRDLEFFNKNSAALKTIIEINAKYRFLDVPEITLTRDYDCEVNYNNVQARDVLIYELQYRSKEFIKYINDANKNRDLYREYSKEINQNVKYGTYKDKCTERKFNKYLRLEKALVKKKIKKAETSFKIKVLIKRFDMGGNYLSKKSEIFYSDEIIFLINKVKDKNGSYFNDKEIYDSIVRVERGKVSNHLRFQIYNRDNYRCQKCGKHQIEANLEIDHIIPVSKGGKTEYNNLQTLCHRCNKEKGNKLEHYDRNQLF